MMHALPTILFILLTTVAVADSAGCPKYDRKSYHHWIDENRDCQNARHEVLIEESLSKVGFKSSKGCRVVSESWNDPYAGRTIIDATKLDIDHMVPLEEAISLVMPIGQESAKEPMLMIWMIQTR